MSMFSLPPEAASLPPSVDRNVLREILSRLPAESHSELLKLLKRIAPREPSIAPENASAMQIHGVDPETASLFTRLFRSD